jgi:hypothetical protein
MNRVVFLANECRLFSGKRSRLKRYNGERKLVADKLKVLGAQLQPRLRSEGYNLDYKVSKHFPNPRNHWQVTGIWLAFTGSKQYYDWAQLNVGLYHGGLAIGIEVPRSSASLVVDSINKLGARAGIDFSPATRAGWGVDVPIDPDKLVLASRRADYETWISIGEWYDVDELPTNLVARIPVVFRALKPIFGMMTANTATETEKTQIIDENTSKTLVIQSAKKFFRDTGSESKPLDVWRKARTVNRRVRTPQTVIRTSQARVLAGLNLEPKKINGEWVQVTPGLTAPKYSQMRKLRETVAGLVSIMGGNPKTVKIMVTDEYSDGRILDEQIFVNALLIDKSPAYWGIVAARELAGLTTKSYYPHVRRMSTLLERLITNKTFLKLVDT